MSIYSQDFTNVINKNLPDQEIEIFWYNYKNFICNFFTNTSSSNILSNDYLYIKNELDTISNKLNIFQQTKNWDNIKLLVSNFQLFTSFYILNIIKKIDCPYILVKNTYILFLKFIKRWNKIAFITDEFKIQIDNWDKNTRLENKFAIVISVICRNMKITKYNDLRTILIQYYNIDLGYWSKDDYKIIMIETYTNIMEIFITRCTIIFMFDENRKVSSPSISILDIISKVYKFKESWLLLFKDRIENKCLTDNISTKKFCLKLKKIIKIEDFEFINNTLF